MKSGELKPVPARRSNQQHSPIGAQFLFKASKSPWVRGVVSVTVLRQLPASHRSVPALQLTILQSSV